jgi:thiol-disulfide isomerase/thioredoxin
MSSKFSNYLLGLVMLIVASVATAQSTNVSDMKFVDLDGKSVQISDYKGKWVVVNLWATWCPPCLTEIPDLIMFQEKNKDSVVVLGVDYEDISVDKVKAFAESQMINYPIVRFPGKIDGRTTPFGPLRGLPTTYMVNPKGILVAARTGMVNDQQLEAFIETYEKNNR